MSGSGEGKNWDDEWGPDPDDAAEEQELRELLYGDVVGVGAVDIQHRLHGARLAAGYVYASEAARLLDVNESTYRHAEDGLRPANIELVEQASGLYGVGQTFLLEGTASTDREILAARLSAILQSTDVDELETYDNYNEILKRLREMRIAAGHESPAAAAGAYGWNRSTYWQHEAGSRGISLDRLIAYSLTMGVRPEWAVTGLGDREELLPISWAEREKIKASPVPAFKI